MSKILNHTSKVLDEMPKAAKVLIFALIILAAYLGYRIYAGDVSPVKSPGELKQSAYVYSNKDVLRTPTPESPELEKIGYSDLVKSQAVASETLDITSCQAKPLVIAVKAGGTVKLKNDGMTARTIAFSVTETYEVAPKSVKSMPVSKTAGTIYSYGCDGSQGPVGIMLVE
jgi:hypothetical protein